MAEGTPISELIPTSNPTGGFFEIIIPDGSGGFVSRKISISDSVGNSMNKNIYDPRDIALDIFASLNIDYDNAASGLVAEDVQNAIDEIADIIDNIVPGEVNTGSSLGSGETIFVGKVGVDFEFRTLKAGANISLTVDVDGSLIISAAGGGGAQILVYDYNFNGSIADTNPGAGFLRLNNANPDLATFIYICDFDQNGLNVGARYDLLQLGEKIVLENSLDPSKSYLFTLTANSVQATGYVKIPVIMSNRIDTIAIGDNIKAGIAYGSTGQYVSVADEAARLDIRTDKRSEGMVCYEEDTRKKYQLVGGIDNANWSLIGINLNLSESTATSTYYIDSVLGSDETGDGTELLPWATIDYAATLIDSKLNEYHLYLYLVGGGTYHITADTADIFAEFLINKTLYIIGDISLVRDDFTAQVADPGGNPFKRVSTVAWDYANQYVGYIGRHDQSAPSYTYAPIFAHDIDNISSPLQTEGHWIGAIYELTSTLIFDDNRGFKQLVGSGKMTIEYMLVSHGISNKVFALANNASATLEFYNCVFNTPTNKSIRFEGDIELSQTAIITANTNKPAVIVLKTTNFELNKTCIFNSNPAGSTECALQLLNGSFIYSKAYLYGFAYGVEYRQGALTSEFGHYQSVFDNIGCSFRLTMSNAKYISGEWYGQNELYLFSTNYMWSIAGALQELFFSFNDLNLIGTVEEGFFVPAAGGLWQGNPTLLAALRDRPDRYIDPENNVAFKIPGLFSEFEYLPDITIIDASATNQIVVGSVAQNESVIVNFSAIRGVLTEIGEVVVSNLNDTIIFRRSMIGDVGLAITKNLNSDEIRVNIADTLANGDDIIIKINDIRRTLT